MYRLRSIIIALAAVIAMSMPASAQFRLGLKGGVNVNDLHFDKNIGNDLSAKENRNGFTGGLTCEYTGIIGIGFDAAVMYAHRSGTISAVEDGSSPTEYSNDYIEIPINLKWKIPAPGIGHIIRPYVFTGPSIAYLCSEKGVENAWKNKTFDAAWNAGGGLQILSHLQIGVSYGWGLTKAFEYKGFHNDPVDAGRNTSWAVTAALYF